MDIARRFPLAQQGNFPVNRAVNPEYRRNCGPVTNARLSRELSPPLPSVARRLQPFVARPRPVAEDTPRATSLAPPHFDPASSSWAAEVGKYTVKIGASSRDIRCTASCDLEGELIVKQESFALVPKATINKLKAMP